LSLKIRFERYFSTFRVTLPRITTTDAAGNSYMVSCAAVSLV
jgi:hypothetical protein